MRTHVHRTAQLGELVVAVFDEAAQYSADPREVSRLATKTVMHMLQRARTRSSRPPSQAACTARQTRRRPPGIER